MTKFIRIGIADKNDNPPYFDKALYEAEVDENEDIQHTVLTVTAKDHDECKYGMVCISSTREIPSEVVPLIRFSFNFHVLIGWEIRRHQKAMWEVYFIRFVFLDWMPGASGEPRQIQ